MMRTLLLMVWGILSTLAASVAAQLLHIELLAIHVPVVIATHAAARRSAFEAYFAVMVVAWFDALLGGGARGPVMLAYLTVTIVLIFSRNRLRSQSVLRLATIVVAASMLWSFVLVLILGAIGSGGWWGTFFKISPLAAAATGAFSLLHFAVMHRIDPTQRLEISEQRRLRH